MKRRLCAILTGVMFGSFAAHAAEDAGASAARMAALERRVQELEAKLERVLANTNSFAAPELAQKVAILERRQELADEATAARAREAPVITAGKNGFSLASADRSYVLALHGYVQGDGRFYVDDSKDTAVDTLLLRRARLIVDGTLGSLFEFRIAPDFGNGQAVVQDAYLDCKPDTLINLRVGRFKTPFDIERLQSSADTCFTELGLPSALTPGYDLGAELYGFAAGGAVEYAAGVFNGVPDGTDGNGDANDNKDLAGRVMVSPFRNSDVAAINGLSVGAAASIGDQDGTAAASALPSLKTPGQQTYFSYAASTYANGPRTRVEPQFYYAAGPFGLLGEYVLSEQDVQRGAVSDRMHNRAWQLTGSFVLTGETPSLKGVQPLSPFNPGNNQWGAFELVSRIGQLNVDRHAFSGGFADRRRSAESAQNWGIGVNWYLTKNAKLMADYDLTAFDRGATVGDRPTESFVSTRAQISF